MSTYKVKREFNVFFFLDKINSMSFCAARASGDHATAAIISSGKGASADFVHVPDQTKI